MSWLDSAACVGEDPELFFPDPVGPSVKILQRAKDVCAGCPVRVECLEIDLSFNAGVVDPKMRPGIYGGLTPGERILLERGAVA